MMQKTLFIKVSIIAVLCLIFAIGLAMIQSLVYERQNNAKDVMQEISEQHVKSQYITTPFILTLTEGNQCEAVKESEKNKKTGCKDKKQVLSTLLPTQTQANQNLQVSNNTYHRGIYRATSFQGTVDFKQKYHTVDKKPEQVDKSDESSEEQVAKLIIPVSDLRGVSEMPVVTINGKKHIAEYPESAWLQGLSYLEVPLKMGLKTTQISNLDIHVSIPLSGTSRVQTVPLGNLFKLSMQSNWQAPKFIGQALPNEKKYGKTGFTASWQNQHLTVNNNQLLNQCIEHSQAHCSIDTSMNIHSKGTINTYTYSGNDSNKNHKYQQILFNSFDVKFAEPNNVYLQTERSMKYALLIIAVSFGSFFLFEVIKSLRIHPIQYLLVGMALLVFYVLLLSLAEQLVFWQAYVIAATACAGLIGWYTFYVLHSVKRAGLFTLILAGQYAGFFTILTIEELNLLIGAILCFVIIASVMYLTRKIDWYQVT